MIKHLKLIEGPPKRVVILGASGFVGSYLQNKLQAEHIPVLSLSSHELDLNRTSEAATLANILSPDDVVVFLSVIGPNRGHDSSALIKNLNMAETVVQALNITPCKHLIYVSSEAVYSAENESVNSDTPPQPQTLYGIMHLAREIVLQTSLPKSIPILIMRPTQIYGANCTHNAYGPCRFLRSVLRDKTIELFGAGEELRDFVYIDDVVQLIYQSICHSTVGCVNIATGISCTFNDLATEVVALFHNESIKLISKERNVKLTHRKFDVTDLKTAFPTLKFTPLKAGLAMTKETELSLA